MLFQGRANRAEHRKWVDVGRTSNICHSLLEQCVPDEKQIMLFFLFFGRENNIPENSSGKYAQNALGVA